MAGLLLAVAVILPPAAASGASPSPPRSHGAGSPSPSVPPSPGPTPPATLPPGVVRPDMIVLLIDDLAEIDDRIWERMPTLRPLFVESGITFEEAIGNDPLCCPGRANLLSGQWAEHHGVILNNGRLFDPRESIATELHDAGYWTGIFGKYFNQTLRLADKMPPGWDRAFIFGGNYWNYPAWADGRLERFGADAEDYSTAVMQGRVVTALRSAPVDAPRFLWLAPFAVHGGYDQDRDDHSFLAQPAPQDVGAPVCADIPAWSTPANFEFDMRDKPTYLRTRPLRPSRDLVSTCEAMLSVDRLLAATLEELRAQGRPEPLVVLTADNGMTWGAHRWLLKHVPYSVQVPFRMRWPQVLGTAPARVAATVSNIDLAPTLCAIAGCVMGPYPNGHGVDGIDLLPLLLQVGTVNLDAAPGDAVTSPSGVTRAPDGRIRGLRTGREVVYTEHLTSDGARGMPPWRGLWTTDESPIGRWVYTRYLSGEEELYDNSNGPCWTWRPGDSGDPCQLRNLASDPLYAMVKAILATTLASRESDPLRVQTPERLAIAGPGGCIRNHQTVDCVS